MKNKGRDMKSNMNLNKASFVSENISKKMNETDEFIEKFLTLPTNVKKNHVTKYLNESEMSLLHNNDWKENELTRTFNSLKKNIFKMMDENEEGVDYGVRYVNALVELEDEYDKMVRPNVWETVKNYVKGVLS